MILVKGNEKFYHDNSECTLNSYAIGEDVNQVQGKCQQYTLTLIYSVIDKSEMT